MDIYHLRFVGTTSPEPDFDTMVAATTIDDDRFEIELAVLWVMPVPTREGDGGVAWNHTLWKSRLTRRTYDIEFHPFSNHLAVDGDEVHQNTDDQLTLEAILDMPFVWIAEPTTSGLILPPRYTDTTNFAKTVALLPVCVECDMPAYSKTDEGNTEATLLVSERTL